jgi:hypothetical protein
MSRFSIAKVVLCVLGAVLASGMVLAQVEPPIVANGSTVANWAVPPYHATSADGGLRTMTDINYGGTFVPMVPCRVFDTRNAAGPYGGPRLIANTTRNFDIDSGPCGPIPVGATAYSMNFGAILPDGANSFITIWPTGSAQPGVSSINPIFGTVVANAAIVPVGSGGAISIFPNTGVHLYGDINGYFTLVYNAGNQLVQIGNNPGGGIGLFANSAATNNSAGVYGFVGPGFTDNVCCGPVGVIGKGVFNGVAGVAQDRATVGVLVTTAGGVFAEGQLGVVGASQTQGFGVNGFTYPNANAAGTAGVQGTALATGGTIFGVKGVSASTSFDAAGVKGVAGSGDPLGDTLDCGPCFNQGLRGASNTGVGAIGISRSLYGVVGVRLATSGTGTLSAGYLGYSATVGVYAQGSYGGTGAKYFIEPHPTDPSLVIKYIALEGPESGTYFRGKGRFQNGIATIDVPEDFRMVTDREGLSIQVTPIGDMATVAVQTIGLDRIVVRGSRNVEFFYTVNGVRRSFKDHVPIQPSEGEFTPEKGDVTLESHRYLTPDQQRVLVQNGTYRPDGAINMETAHRLGWDRVWAERERPTPQPSDPTSP